MRELEKDVATIREVLTEALACDALDHIAAALPLIADVVEAAEREGSGVAVIRALGFVGNAHYCPDCMNHFHDSCGQHEPGCSVLMNLVEDEEWFDPQPFHALTALRNSLEKGSK